MAKKKWIIWVNGEATEVFEGTESEAESRAYEVWLESADQDYQAEPYTKEAAKEAGLEEDE